MNTKIDLKTIMDLHLKWLAGDPEGYMANLYMADLSRADLSGANLSGAVGAELAIAMSCHLPEGDIIGWKKCQDGVLVKLLIPSDAKRSHGASRKCRAGFVRVLEVIGAEVGISLYDGVTEYRVGETVRPDGWDDDRWNICGKGIHFYITRAEAEAHN